MGLALLIGRGDDHKRLLRITYGIDGVPAV